MGNGLRLLNDLPPYSCIFSVEGQNLLAFPSALTHGNITVL
jgi:hypothetical protein